MSKHYDEQLRQRDSLINRTKQIYHEAIKYHHTHAWILSRTREMWASPHAKYLCQWAREHVRGYEKALFDGLHENPDSKLVLAYDVGSKRYTIDSPEYKALSPADVSRDHTWAGFVWRANIHCAFSD